MIVVKLFGGAKKSFSTEKMDVDLVDVSIQDLLDYMIEHKPADTIEFDTNNILVAINDVDSSALNGFSTKIQKNDVVSIIPIIHGGSFNRIQFKISNSIVEIFHIQYQKSNIEFLEYLRKKFPKLIIQCISSNFILNKSHAKKIITISLYAKSKNTLLSKKIETDILLRFAATNQIEKAINIVGIKENTNFDVIALGQKSQLNKLHDFLKLFKLSKITKNNASFLIKQFKISKKQLDITYSKNPIEDLLVEKAAILIS